MNIVSYGGGTNSTALLVGCAEKGVKVDAILFADTGGEKPHTYEYVSMLSVWLIENGMPGIEIVRVESRTLEEDCLKRKALPSIAYGFKSCSQRFKAEPQEKWLNNWEPAKSIWKSDGKVVRLIWFDYGEQRRAKDYQDKKYTNEYPLIDWKWGRNECIEAINRAGLPLPGKSACFFCPNSKPSEIKQLNEHYPELISRSIKIEDNADLTHIKGLGRNYSWRDVINQNDMFGDHCRDWTMPCGCFDGD